MQIKDLGEFPFIKSIASGTVIDQSTVKVGIGDDCAVYTANERMDQLITTDTMVDGVHFSAQFMRPYDIGYRLMTANFSDIAAMGGEPKQAVISVAAPKNQDVKTLNGIYDGIKAQCREYNVNLVGGDTVSTSGPLILTVTIIGEVPEDSAVLRSTAKVGDYVGITNTVGLSAVGLDVMSYDEKGYFASKNAFQRPNPQIKLGSMLRAQKVNAMNDISDGLVSELYEIAESSHAHIEIKKELIPIHEEVIKWGKLREIDPLEFALYGGEDFQLVFTADKTTKEQLEQHPLIRFIGEVVDKKVGVSMIDDENQEPVLLEKAGYQHFKD